MKKDILGINIDDINMDEAVALVEKWICPDGILHLGSPANEIRRENPGKHYIVTPNPEIIVAAQKDEKLKAVLNGAGLAIPDGTGLKFSGKVKNTVAGVDLMEELIKLSQEKGFTIGLLGGKDGVAEKCRECLLKRYPGLKVSFASGGGKVDNYGNVIARSPDKIGMTWQSTIKDPSSAFGGLRMTGGVDILFIAFGHIKQEKWMASNLEKVPAHVMMGVGGAFDYLSGNIPRAPKWIRNLGFEWLFRLIIQPWRIKRQLALIQYIWLLLVNPQR